MPSKVRILLAPIRNTLMPKWFADGLNFTCTRCSNCCRHESGYVFLSERDIERLAEAFRLEVREFVEQYCKRVDLGVTTRTSLREQNNFDCVFFRDGRCSVYPVRPLQCRSYPFWPSVLENADSWNREAGHCPGINVGARHSDQTVLEWLEARAREPMVESEPEYY